jgi:hypothetical protein
MGWVMMSERELNRVEVLAPLDDLSRAETQSLQRQGIAGAEWLLRHGRPTKGSRSAAPSSQADPSAPTAINIFSQK